MTSLAVSAWPVEFVFEPFAMAAALLVVLSFARSLGQSLTART